jgi:hypothetical protein
MLDEMEACVIPNWQLKRGTHRMRPKAGTSKNPWKNAVDASPIGNAPLALSSKFEITGFALDNG